MYEKARRARHVDGQGAVSRWSHGGATAHRGRESRPGTRAGCDAQVTAGAAGNQD